MHGWGEYSMKLLQNIINMIIKRKNKDKSSAYKYKDLAPEDNIVNGDEYFEELDWALRNCKVNNIALSGPYGAGKSSVLESFFSKHSEFNPIMISLASFGEKETEPGGKKQESEELAKGFLQQLFYKVDYRKIPQSRYRKLHRISEKRIFFNLIAIILLVIMLLCIFNSNYLEKLFTQMKGWGADYGIGSILCFILSCIVFFIILSVISFVLKWTFAHIGNAEFNIADKAKFSTDKSNPETIFNKYLDEIVYFFEETKYDVVILEDIDRYNNTEIFLKLRELNRLLNSNESIKQHIQFIYALKDDFFENSTDRTKFFDFIISVIPYINSTNSDNLLRRRIKEIKESGMQIEIADEYITKVSPFISDMRVLTSIFNDFVLYKNTLNKDKELKLSDEQMLSLMIYKNLYPQDFAALESECGNIKDSMKAKGRLIEKEIEEKQKKLDLLKERIESSAKDSIGAVEEFKIKLLYNLSQKNGLVSKIQANGESYKFATIMEDEFDIELLCNSNLTVTYISANGNSSNSFVVNNIDEYSFEDKSVLEQWQALKLVDKGRRELALKEIEDLRDEIYKIKALKIQDMIKMYGTDFLFEEETFVENNKLLIFFLRNGYIDETYVNYINYFHPDSITVDEQKYILNVRNFDGLQDYEQEIIHKQRVVDRLVSHEFRQVEILNFSLIEYLFSINTEREKKNELLTLLSSRTDDVKEFIQRYLQKYDMKSKNFIMEASKCNPFLWLDLCADETIPDEVKTHYFDMVISYSDIDYLLCMNEKAENSIAEYLECTEAIFTKLKLSSVDKVKELLHFIDVKIKKIETLSVDKGINDLIFKESKYEINRDMIQEFVAWKCPEFLENLAHSNYTTLLRIGDDNVLSYINYGFDVYMRNVFYQDGNNQESEDSILRICSKYDFSEDSYEVIDSQKTVFGNVCEILDWVENREVIKDFVEYLFKNRKMVVSWKNIISYYECYGLTDFIFNIIESNINNLCNDSDEPEDLLVLELLSFNWEARNFIKFIKRYKLGTFTKNFDEIPTENVNILLDENYIEFSIELYKDLLLTYPECIIKYILNHYNDFFGAIEEIGLEKIPIDEIMKSGEFKISDKIIIIHLMSADQISEDVAYVLRETDLPVGKDYVLAAWSLLDNKKKYQLLLNHLEEFENSELPNMFNKLEYMYCDLAKRDSRHKVSLYCNEYNEALLKKLEKKRYVSSTGYEEREKTIFDPLPRKIKEKYVYGWVRAIKNN